MATKADDGFSQGEIAVTNLLLDQTNPRLEAEQASQIECLEAILHDQGDKVLNLAGDIAEVGLDPSMLFMVTPSKEDSKLFVVLDANRRLAALRLLSRPTSAKGLDKKSEKALIAAAQQYAKTPIKQVLCAIFPNREAATRWIRLRHGGEQGGRGQVNWRAVETARFQERLEGKARASGAIEAISLVRRRGKLDDDTIAKLGNVPVTTVQRLLNDPAVRERLGLALEDGRLALTIPETEALKGLTRIIKDAAHKKLPVSRVDNKKDRERYIDTFAERELPSEGTPRSAAKPVDQLGDDDAAMRGRTSAPKRKTQQTTQERPNVIPRSYKVVIADTKSYNIFRELQRLKVEDFANAAGGLLRVFLELSVDRFLAEKKLMKPAEIDNTKLKGKIDTSARHLKESGLMDKRDLTAVHRMTDANHSLASSVDTLHQYVHSRSFAPTPRDLKSAWDSLEPFFTQLWS